MRVSWFNEKMMTHHTVITFYTAGSVQRVWLNIENDDASHPDHILQRRFCAGCAFELKKNKMMYHTVITFYSNVYAESPRERA